MEAKATGYGDVMDLTAEERARANKGKVRALRADLVRDEDNVERFIRFEARCTKKFGPAAGIFVRQLVFWSDKGADPDGWIYKSRAEFEEETGLSRRQQENARKVLKAAGVLEEEDRLAAPHFNYKVMHYRVKLEMLTDLLEDPHSTLNQWKRGRRYEKDASGKFVLLPEEVVLDNTEPDHRHGNTEPEVRHGNTEQNHRLDNDEHNVRHGIREPDHRHGSTEHTTENTPQSSSEGTSEGTSESSSKEFSFQEGANGFSSRPTPAPIIKKVLLEPKNEHDVNGSRQASFSASPDLDAELLNEIQIILNEPPFDNAAEEWLAHLNYGKDSIYAMEAVAKQLGWFLSEDLRRHISEAMRREREGV